MIDAGNLAVSNISENSREDFGKKIAAFKKAAKNMDPTLLKVGWTEFSKVSADNIDKVINSLEKLRNSTNVN